jgi:hypothetical protein
MKIVLTYTRKWDWYDALCIVFATAITVWIAKILMWGLLGIFMIGGLLGFLAPYLAALLRHPPQDFDSNTEKKS